MALFSVLDAVDQVVDELCQAGIFEVSACGIDLEMGITRGGCSGTRSRRDTFFLALLLVFVLLAELGPVSCGSTYQVL